MKPKHTPGPWLQSHRVCDAEGNRSTQVYNQEGKTICTVEWYPVYEDWGISTSREANAKLIAAAPELLSTLRALALSMRAHPDNLPNSEFEVMVDRASDIIEKATGE